MFLEFSVFPKVEKVSALVTAESQKMPNISSANTWGLDTMLLPASGEGG